MLTICIIQSQYNYKNLFIITINTKKSIDISKIICYNVIKSRILIHIIEAYVFTINDNIVF